MLNKQDLYVAVALVNSAIWGASGTTIGYVAGIMWAVVGLFVVTRND